METKMNELECEGSHPTIFKENSKNMIIIKNKIIHKIQLMKSKLYIQRVHDMFVNIIISSKGKLGNRIIQ